jgi:hypothetical protein
MPMTPRKTMMMIISMRTYTMPRQMMTSSTSTLNLRMSVDPHFPRDQQRPVVFVYLEVRKIKITPR